MAFESKQDLGLFRINERVAILASPLELDRLPALLLYLCNTFNMDQFKIYNFTDEEEFNIELDLPNVVNCPFAEGNPPSLELLIAICSNIDAFLSLNSKNVILLHCKAGSGRSSMIAACTLLHSFGQTFDYSDKAVDEIHKKRGLNSISIPSQLRYVKYYERLLKSDFLNIRTYRLLQVRLNSVPNSSSSIVKPGCYPYLVTHLLSKDENMNYLGSPGPLFNQWKAKLTFDGGTGSLPAFRCSKTDNFADLIDIKDSITSNIVIRGDTCLSVFSEGDLLCQIFFHTSFIDGDYLHFRKSAIDIAAADTKNKVFSRDFDIEVFLEPVEDSPSANDLSDLIENEPPRWSGVNYKISVEEMR